MNEELLKYKKGKLRTLFTPMAVKLMGKRMNGWIPDVDVPPTNAQGFKALTKVVADDLALDAKYKDAINQGREYLNGGRTGEALEHFRLAVALKPVPYAKGLVTQAENLLAAEQEIKETDSQFKELTNEAEKALQAKDYSAALELFISAKELRGEEWIDAKIEECEKALAQA